MIYLRLFIAFMKIGFTSFGGMSMIPVIMQEMKVNQWMTAEDLTNLIAIAEMTPGPKVPKMDLSNMTDQQMREQINRAILEQQYNNMFNPKRESKGREYVSRILDSAGNVLAITSSALGIALAIKELRG